MGEKISVTLEVELDEHVSTPEEIATRMSHAVNEVVKGGMLNLEPDDTLDFWDVRATVGKTTIDRLAELDTWEERCRQEAISDYGYDTETDIAAHISSAQTDLDYLTGQDETLEQMIASAREETGYEAPDIPIPQDDDPEP